MKKSLYVFVAIITVAVSAVTLYFAIPKPSNNKELKIDTLACEVFVGEQEKLTYFVNKNADLFFTNLNDKVALLSDDSKYIIGLAKGETSIKIVAVAGNQTKEALLPVIVKEKETGKVPEEENNKGEEDKDNPPEDNKEETFVVNFEFVGVDYDIENIYLHGKNSILTIKVNDNFLNETLKISVFEITSNTEEIFPISGNSYFIKTKSDDFSLKITFSLDDKTYSKTYKVVNL